MSSSHGKVEQRSGRLRRLAVLAVIAGLAVLVVLWGRGASTASAIEFTDVRRQTLEFIAYNQKIELTAEQEAIKREALEALPAPCCDDRTAYTCCCNCNMAQAWWGLSKVLIAEQGYGAEEVRAVVAEWFEFINPDGFSGDSCYTGRCALPFRANGCGGMDASDVRF